MQKVLLIALCCAIMPGSCMRLHAAPNAASAQLLRVFWQSNPANAARIDSLEADQRVLLEPGLRQGAPQTLADRLLSRQLAVYLSYPPHMQQAHREGVVVITFRLTRANRLASLQVHSQDQRLNAYLAVRLAGKYVWPGPQSQPGLYTVRLRFRLT